MQCATLHILKMSYSRSCPYKGVSAWGQDAAAGIKTPGNAIAAFRDVVRKKKENAPEKKQKKKKQE